MDKIDIHEDLCNELHDLYVDKNSDYGDSFSKVRIDIPNAILVRLSDKLNRLKSLMNKPESEQKVRYESIDDTLMDIANYALLELVERRAEDYDDIGDDDEDEDCVDIDDAEDFETYLKNVPFKEKMHRIHEMLDDIFGNKDEDEIDLDLEYTPFKNITIHISGVEVEDDSED